MSLDYARQIIKISLSLICDRIGFNRTSETSIDILVDVCEREFQRMFSSIHRMIDINDQTTLTFEHLTKILFDDSSNSLNNYSKFIDLFADIRFPKDLPDLPRSKSNPINLRIPPSNCEQVLRRNENSSTEYIYSWLPLYPDEENNVSQTTHTAENELHAETDRTQKENLVKVELQHAANLSCLTNSKLDSTGFVLPTGTKPSRSLPKIVYRPKRLVELELTICEKNKKEQQEKENTERDVPTSHHQNSAQPPTPLRLTIPKTSLSSDKSLSSNKKISLLGSNLSSNVSGLSNSGISCSISPMETISSSTTNLPTETTVNNSSTNNDVPLTMSVPPLPSNGFSQPSNNITEPTVTMATRCESSSFPVAVDSHVQTSSSTSTKKSNSLSSSKINDQTWMNLPTSQSNVEQISSSSNIVLDLSKKSSKTEKKIPSLKLNLKKVQVGPTNPTTSTVKRISSLDRFDSNDEKSADPTSTTKTEPIQTAKINIKLPASLLQSNKLDETKARNTSISPSLNQTNNDRPVEQEIKSRSSSNSKQERSLKTSIDLKSMQKIGFDRLSNVTNETDKDPNNEKSKKKSKKKKSVDPSPQSPSEKKFKRDNEINQEKPVELDSNGTMAVSREENFDKNFLSNKQNENQEKVSTGIRLKIKLNKPASCNENQSQNNESTNVKVDKEEKKTNVELKTEPIRVTLPLTSSSSSRRKSSQVKKFVREKDNVEQRLTLDDDFHNSIDDVPLLERTSPNKQLIINGSSTLQAAEEKTSTDKSPNKKKNVGASKKKINKSLVDVAVIEEKRIDHELHSKIWICPSCNRPDNGQEAMIACDLCDDWYHWECVGIVEEPAENTSWFCPKCHQSNPSTNSTQTIKSSNSSKAKRKKLPTQVHTKQVDQQQAS